jgi:transposase InsO family protein
LAYLAHRAGWKRIVRDTTIANVSTLRRWYRRLITAAPVNSGGKPPINETTVALILRMATENSWGNDAWGRQRIRDELGHLDIDISASSVRNILHRHGIPPAPGRGRGRDEPVAVIAADTVAIDFCTTTVGTSDSASPLRCAYILIAIHLVSRAATVIGITVAKPNADFMEQCAMALIGPGGFLSVNHATNIRMDHDGLFSPDFRKRLSEAGINVQRTDVKCPWQNGHAERFVQTIKNGILRKAIWADEAALRLGCEVFIQHDRTERPHQALDGRIIEPPANSRSRTGPIMCRQHLGGLINHYYRLAC